MKSVAIVGGGAAGIAAAMECVESGHRVTLIESLPRLGGRLGSFTDRKTGFTFDFGEHLILKSYAHTLKLLEKIDCSDAVSLQKRLSIPFHHPHKGIHHFKTNFFPAPLNFAAGILKFGLLDCRDRFKLICRLKRLASTADFLSGMTAGKWLEGASRSEIEAFWQPVILSALNCMPEEADVQILKIVFKEGFLRGGGLGFFRMPQKQIFHDCALKALQTRQVEVLLGNPVSNIDLIAGTPRIKLKDGKRRDCERLILAVPPESLKSLLGYNLDELGIKRESLDFDYSDICNLHLVFAEKLFGEDFGCMIETLPQWFFRQRWSTGKTSGYAYSLTISAADKFITDRAQIIESCIKDLAKCGGNISGNKLLYSKAVYSRKATIVVNPEAFAGRPSCETKRDDVFFAGDWTDTGLPATIESAVKSGFEAGRRAAI